LRIQLWKARGIPGYLICQIDEETGSYLPDDAHSQLVPTDWDYPSVAQAFGWSLRAVQWPAEDSDPCDHSSTDGTVVCRECGMPASKFIGGAFKFLDENIGRIVSDPGYFSA
jgi:hypothetical protein